MTRLLNRLTRGLQVVLTALMTLMLVPVTLQILSRYTGLIPRYIWTEEVARFCFVWIVMIGSTIAVRESNHFVVDLLPTPKTRRDRGFAQLIVHLAMLLLAGVFFWYGMEFARFGARQNSEMSGINMLAIYVSFPLAGLLWLLFLIEKIQHDIRLMVDRPGERAA